MSMHTVETLSCALMMPGYAKRALNGGVTYSILRNVFVVPGLRGATRQGRSARICGHPMLKLPQIWLLGELLQMFG